MKRSVLIILLLVLAVPCLAFGQAQAAQPPKPGPEQQKLKVYVGDWTYEGETHATPFGPAGKFMGKASVRAILGGFFIEWHAEEKGTAGTTDWVEIDGYDPISSRFTFYYFDNSGMIQTVSYTMEGTKLSFSGTQSLGGKQAKVRGTGVFAADLASWVERFELSMDGRVWTPFWESRFTKVK